MGILGHGVDIVLIEAMHRLLLHAEDDFLDECFTAAEIAELPDRPARRRLAQIAGRFAAKEAVVKALGTGFGDGVAFSDVEVGQGTTGCPSVTLHGKTAQRAAACGVRRWCLSISVCDAMAFASAIAIGSAVGDQAHSGPR